jgi:hypothetical protein
VLATWNIRLEMEWERQRLNEIAQLLKRGPCIICYRDLVLAVLVEIAVRHTALFQVLLVILFRTVER